MAIVAGSLAGCAGVPIPGIQQSNLSDNNAKGLIGSDGNVEFRVVKIMDASKGWLEYVIAGRNKSNRPISNIRGFVIDEAGGEHEAAISIADIQSSPEFANDMLLVTGLATATTLMAVPFLGPIVMLGYGVNQMTGIDNEFSLAQRFSKSLQGAAVPGKEDGTGSFFFPAVRPSGVKIGYVIDGVRRYVTASTSTQVKTEHNSVVFSNEHVREIQQRLNRLGYNAGPEDGIAGARTGRAVAAYQRDIGSPANGHVDQVVLNALRNH